MKHPCKSPLLAALALSAAAPCMAQSSVQISGVLDVWAGNARSTSAAGVRSSVSQLGHSGMTTSYWSLSGSEDLGGGLSVLFTLDSYVRPDIGGAGRTDTDGYFSRNAHVGLRHAQWGTLVLGRTSTPLIGALFSTNAFLTSTPFSSAFVNHWSGAVAGDTSLGNAVRYTSPAWGGWRVYALASLGEERPKGPDRSRGQALEARADYSNGPAYATVSYRGHNLSNNEDGRKQNAWIAGGSWDFGFAKAYAQYVAVDDSYTNRAQNVQRDGYTLGARMPMGSSGVFMLSHSRATIDDEDAATPSRRRTTAVGYDHTLSKRTDVYLNWLDSAYQSPRGSKLRRIGLGLRHRF